MSADRLRSPSAGAPVPKLPLDPAARWESDLPETFRAGTSADAVQQFLFDPASLHHADAYRASDPQFADPARGQAWRATRRRALHLVLSAIAGSPWADALVLRGSVAMSVWFPETARDPGDLDFVVVPRSRGVHDKSTAVLLDGVAAAAEAFAAAHGEGITISAESAVLGDIWTYDRVPGRRMVLSWAAPGLPGGDLQLDFVFNEILPEPPEPLALPYGGQVLAASPALSLAWKLLWLVSDMHPQGKDLYDAVLLAERYPVRPELLQQVFREQPVSLEQVVESAGEAHLGHFTLEYPQLREVAPELAGRLVRAVRPAFAEGR